MHLLTNVPPLRQQRFMVFINNGRKPHKEWNKVEGHDKHPMPKTAMATTSLFRAAFFHRCTHNRSGSVSRQQWHATKKREKERDTNWNGQKWRWRRRAAENAGKRKHNKTFHYFKIIVMIYLKMKFIICLYFDIRTQMKTSEHNVWFVFRLFVLICVAVSLFFGARFYLFRWFYLFWSLVYFRSFFSLYFAMYSRLYLRYAF